MQNFDLNLYNTFCTVVEAKSITKAAEKLLVSRQAVSYSIKHLESALGGQLFFRTSKGVVLTQKAEKLYTYIKQSLDNITVGENIFKEDKEIGFEHIYIGCNPALFDIHLHRYIKNFQKIYPNIQFHFFSKSTLNELIQMLKDHEIDMIFCTSVDSINKNNFSKKIFEKLTHCFVCNKDFKFLSDKKNVTLENLAKFPLLLLNNNPNVRNYLENFFKGENIDLNPLMEFTNISSLNKLVKDGVGIGHTIRESVAEDLKTGNLFEISVDGMPYTKDIGVFYDEKYLTHVASKFIEMF